MASLTHFQFCIYLWILIESCFGILKYHNETVCPGTSNELSASGSAQFRYKKLQDMYTNCTHIQGSLEILYLEPNNENIKYDLSFLKSIKEVTGYVLILSVFTDYVPLENLQIIRGTTLYKGKYSLYVALNSHEHSEHGLRELRFKSLTEILKGKVFFKNNNKLCYEQSIIWSDINPREKPPVEYEYEERRRCDKCDPSCKQPTTGELACWGSGPDMCQKLSQGEVCHKSCDGRCYGSLPNQCCHPECAAGCSGPLKTDCLTCRNFRDEDSCVRFCPPLKIYDSQKFVSVNNPDGKYTYGSLCLKECPADMLKEDGRCVIKCAEGRLEDQDGVCQLCKGPCPRGSVDCKGTGLDNYLKYTDLERFTDCTKIDGTLKILTPSFERDEFEDIPAIHPNNLTVFQYVKEITGNLIIQSNHKDFKNLSYFRSLEYIYGREPRGELSLSIIMTQLESLELVSLKKIRRKNVMIAGNQNLCYVKTVNWRNLLASDNIQPQILQNKPEENCTAEGKVCDPECSSDGCWGHGAENCLSCRNFNVEERRVCVNSCSDVKLHYEADKKTCKPCHSQCKDNCSGPEPNQCDSCINVSIIDSNNSIICLAKCPQIMYPDQNNICQKCHKNCADGCTGPLDLVGPNGCNSCEVGFREFERDLIIRCLPVDTNFCPDGYHIAPVNLNKDNPLNGKRMCEPCHELCETCNGAGLLYCIECKFLRHIDSCVKRCYTMMFPDNITKECEPCHQECRSGCSGPDTSDCTACKNFKIYTNEEHDKFNCTLECPEHLPYLVKDAKDNIQSQTESRTVCADDTHPEVKALQLLNAEEEKKIALIVGPSVGGILGIGVLIGCIAWCCQKRAKAKEKTAKLTARMTGCDEDVPLTPTSAKPDLAQLRLIKENDLRRGGIIGSGAFGTVYKGFWIPEGENIKIPVAIKVLQEGTSPNQNKELLEEARVMTSVEHPCCVRILAVCMAVQMMLITQLMPLGCLLDYVRKNKEHIGSKVLLNWCTQIAKGMVYLEDRGIVHRDLAARNVLLYTPSQVKITDFGLAKLLDYDEEVYQAAGGKMPIKWLALECIQHRIFTHKSDVWSYGVTVWELMTYGLKPYDNIRARDVPDLLEKGERLPQPHCCTIDVYMIMIKCWMLDADSRPSFLELQEEFAKMARDPGRYLVIQGDTLMRLPSDSYDKNDLIRCLSVANDGGNEEVMEADDYLQPHLNSDDSIDNNNAQVKTPLLPLTPGAYNIDGRLAPKPRREKRYAHLDNAVQLKQQRQTSPTRGRGDSINSRYSSDPVKVLKDKDDIELGLTSLDNNGLPYEVPLHLPVDEDDYLQPKSHNPAAYMDLSEKGYYQNEKDVFYEEEEYGQEEDEVSKPLTNGVDNPEYFDSSQKQNGISMTPLRGGQRGPNPKPKNLNYYNDLNKFSPRDKKQSILKVNNYEDGCETSI